MGSIHIACFRGNCPTPPGSFRGHQPGSLLLFQHIFPGSPKSVRLFTPVMPFYHQLYPLVNVYNLLQKMAIEI